MLLDANLLSISDPTQTAIGSLKICKIQAGSNDAIWSSRGQTETPFAPSSFNEEKPNTLNLSIRCSDEYSDFFSQLDCWAVEYIADNSLRLCGKQLSLNKVKQMYRPCLKKKGNFDPLLRTKISSEGLHRTRYWSLDRTSRLEPDCWPLTMFKTRIRISYLYVTGDALGLAPDPDVAAYLAVCAPLYAHVDESVLCERLGLGLGLASCASAAAASASGQQPAAGGRARGGGREAAA